MDEARYKRFMSRIEEIESVGDKLKLLKIHFLPYLNSLRTQNKNVEYLAVGTQVIEFILGKIVLVIEHAINVSLLEVELESKSDVRLEIEVPLKRNGENLGNLLESISRHKLFIEIGENGKIQQEIGTLNDRRKSCVHNLITEYGGKIESANSEISSYVSTNPIEVLLERLIDLQSKVDTDRIKRQNWAKAKKGE